MPRAVISAHYLLRRIQFEEFPGPNLILFDPFLNMGQNLRKFENMHTILHGQPGIVLFVFEHFNEL